jgi:NAD(P)-dependent dehydrogenase (short-subunit alcohol dehydrogenase family)
MDDLNGIVDGTPAHGALGGKVILITGGGRGLGAAIARRLARGGAYVMVADRRWELAEQAANEIVKSGGKALSIEMDVKDPTSVDAALLKVVQKMGGLDAVINNAGIDKTVSIEELTFEDWQEIIGVNLTGPFIVAKRALPLLREQGGGHIINIASTAAKRAWPNASAYHASKWGLLGFSHALFTEARQFNIKVTAVICGGMRTPFLLERFPDLDIENLQDPADVAETVKSVLLSPTAVPEITVLPLRETSWP